MTPAQLNYKAATQKMRWDPRAWYDVLPDAIDVACADLVAERDALLGELGRGKGDMVSAFDAAVAAELVKLEDAVELELEHQEQEAKAKLADHLARYAQ